MTNFIRKKSVKDSWSNIVKKRVLFLVTLTIIFITSVCFADAMRFDGWTTLIIPGEVEFQIPPTMEVQGESYKALMKKFSPEIYKGSYPKGSVKLMAQQKGLTDNAYVAKNYFVRATVQVTTDDNEPLFPKFGKPLGFSPEDLAVLEDSLIEGLKMGLDSPSARNFRIVGITQHTELIRIDGKEAVHFAYISQNKGYPPVYNDIYMFYNRNKIYRVSTMIRSTEYAYWTQIGSDVRNIVRTLHPLD